jgi:hypothetical protein
MPRKKPPRRYPIEWKDTTWEARLWSPHETFPQVLALVDGVARDSGRQQFADVGDTERVDRRAIVLARGIQSAMRTLALEEMARIINQVDVKLRNGTIRRRIIVKRDRATRSTADQLKILEKAVRSGSEHRIEAAWFGLTDRAHEYLNVGLQVARRRGDLRGYDGPLEAVATIIPVRMLARELLSLILPHAIHAVARAGRRPAHLRDEALARVLAVFVEITGIASAAACREGHGEPVGPGADFVRAIEAIYGTKLMPAKSTHAVARAKVRLRNAAG